MASFHLYVLFLDYWRKMEGILKVDGELKIAWNTANIIVVHPIAIRNLFGEWSHIACFLFPPERIE